MLDATACLICIDFFPHLNTKTGRTQQTIHVHHFCKSLHWLNSYHSTALSMFMDFTSSDIYLKCWCLTSSLAFYFSNLSFVNEITLIDIFFLTLLTRNINIRRKKKSQTTEFSFWEETLLISLSFVSRFWTFVKFFLKVQVFKCIVQNGFCHKLWGNKATK